MTLGYSGRLYILAFDHRGTFQKKMFGISGEPDAEQTRTIVDAKALIFAGFERALREGAPRDAVGVLVDEQFGADVARSAQRQGVSLAMPVEKSGQDEFDFQYGDDFGSHIEDFDPDFSKVLVRYNPDGDAGMNRRQSARLRTLSDWLHAKGRRFLFELLVPAEKEQLEAVGGDGDRYDAEVRPDLVVRAIAELQAAGIEPDIWKIEGLETSDDCRRVAAQARSGGRDGVVCIVLGRAAPQARVEHWLRQGARVAGYSGFAIGRTIWWEALRGYLDESLDRDAASSQIASNYRNAIGVYEEAAAPART